MHATRPLRTCARPLCSAPATALLGYDYAGRRAWLDELDDDVNPHAHDLCAEHADGLVVPRGWTCEDHRSSLRPLFPAPVVEASIAV